jgi:hypothetical protein
MHELRALEGLSLLRNSKPLGAEGIREGGGMFSAKQIQIIQHPSKYNFQKSKNSDGVVVHICNPST